MFNIQFIDSIDEIPEWVTGDDLEEVKENNFERMDDEGQSLLAIQIGDKVYLKRDGGEPEDNTFGRDWSWVDGMIAAAYAEGVKNGAALAKA